MKTGHFGKPFTPSHPAEGNAQERRAHVQLQPKRLYCHLSPGRGLPRRRGSGGQGRAPSIGVWRATCWCECPDVGMLRLGTLLLAFSAQEAATLSCSSHIVSILFCSVCTGGAAAESHSSWIFTEFCPAMVSSSLHHMLVLSLHHLEHWGHPDLHDFTSRFQRNC